MSNSLVALGVQTPQINSIAQFDQSQGNAINAKSQQMAQARQGLEWVGSMALGAMGGKMDGQADPEKWGQGLKMLAGQGVDASVIEALQSRPDLAPVIARASLDTMQQLSIARDERDYELALKRFDLSVSEAAEARAARTAQANAPAELGLTPQYGVDAQGNPVLIQIGKDGKGIQTAMPEGVSLSKEPIRLDAGTHFVLLDPITRQSVGTIPKENYQQAYDSASGGTAGKRDTEARLDAPSAIATAQRTLSQIQALKEDPGLPWAVGGMGWTPNVAGNPQAGTISRIEQLQGAAFLEAFESLKGGGHITEIEGTKATNAMARLQRSQSPEEFKQALTELEEIVTLGMERAQRQVRSGGGAQSSPAAGGGSGAAAPSGGIDDLLDKYR